MIQHHTSMMKLKQVYLEDDQIKFLAKIKKDQGVPEGETMRRALREYMKKFRKKEV